MSNLVKAAQQALEALEQTILRHDPMRLAAIDALRAALAEYDDEPVGHREPVQEPVAWLFTNLQSGDYDFCYQEDEHDHDREMWHKQPLYTAPPQRKPLTDEEIYAAIKGIDSLKAVEVARVIEKAHGIS